MSGLVAAPDLFQASHSVLVIDLL
ncbi:hypothetical protein IQ217_08620 [Synechocystis salina LEGE 00031]|uniref:Uncharacterized protein n=1 Tax=Synechocystis salina LEGE 00031 TaxID=1828736 RepID=A0ABR9VRD1_9SYNC|nr:hypothetical protein [Synechocystis salina LEGE 00041]MBE9253904.1 hypothetical protein [Synechocystis salina LEGE 00031]